MSKLPFVIQPRIKPELVNLGNEDIGVLKVRKLGYITVGEQSQIEATVYKESELQLRALKLADKICKAENLTRTEVAAFLDKPDSNWDLATKYQAEVSELLDFQTGMKGRLCEVTVIIQNRVIQPHIFDEQGNILPAYLINGEIDPTVIGLEDWTVDDTTALNPSLMVEFVSFINNERLGWGAEESEGKILASKNKSRKSKPTSITDQSTGQKFTGESKTVA